MVSLGEIAVQAGVRSPNSQRNKKVLADGAASGGGGEAGRNRGDSASTEGGIASGSASTARIPYIHEPSPVPASASASASGNREPTSTLEKTAERSASALDMYATAAKEASATRSSSTPPEAAVAPAQQQGPGQLAGHTHGQAGILSPHLHVPHIQHHHPHHYPVGEGAGPVGSADRQDDSPGTDPSPASQASTSIIPEHYQYPLAYMAQPSSPPFPNARSPASSAAGPFSNSSSPSYIHHHHQQAQPMYAYHTQFYAPQYPYPPPMETPQQAFFPNGNPGSVHPRSPVMQAPVMSPPNFYAPTFYYTTPSPVPPMQEQSQARQMGHQPQSASEESSSSGRQISSDGVQHQAQYVQQQPQQQTTYIHYAPYPPQAGMQYMTFSPQGGAQQSAQSFASYDVSQVPSNASMSPVLPGGFAVPSSARNSADFSAMHSPYRQVNFAMPGQQAYPAQQMFGGSQHLRYSTAGTDASSINPYGFNASIGSSMAYQQHAQPPQHLRMSQQSYAAPAQPSELARGHLAQAKLRDAVGAYDPNFRLPVSQAEKRRQDTGEQRLPRPPAHSPWALWVGNVPSDATHAELWRFFSTRPPPGLPEQGSEAEKDMLEAEAQFPDMPPPDYTSVGIDSIHLISRSNCCFVNMASKRHLDHAIQVCNGLSLRPVDPRCKNLVCRVRKKEDDTKTGVGAQRGKGMHQAWALEQERMRKEANSAEDAMPTSPSGVVASAGDSPQSARQTHHRASASTTHSASTSSTTSSFLGRHFPKRFFILKSHTEEDLHLSVERGLWATQSHNEPVLDQAFRTSGSVYLVFGANKSGEFFGYAKMSGPILTQEKRMSWMSRGANPDSGESSGSSNNKSTASKPTQPPIPEADEGSALDDKDPSAGSLQVPTQPPSTKPVFSPSASHLVANSPQPLSENQSPAPGPHSHSADSRMDYLNARAHMTDPVSLRPPESADVRRGDSLDPRVLTGMQRMDISVISSASAAGVGDQLAAGSSEKKGVTDDDGIIRKDTALSPEERNARLEILEKEAEEARDSPTKSNFLQDAMEQGWGKPFKVEWVRVQKLPFHRTRHLRNAFNGNREVKISRDGTELEPSVGGNLLELFWKDPTLDLGASTRPVPQINSPSLASDMYMQ